MKNRHSQKALLMLLAMGLSSPVVLGQSDPLLDDAQSVLSSEQIDINGTFQAPKQETAADRIEKLRKQLEQRNEDMVQKKIENIRLQEEQKLANKLQSAFSGQNFDQVNVSQAATQKKVVAPLPVAEVKSTEKKNKVIPTVGVLNITGENGLELESSLNIGVAVESQVHERFSVGVGVGFANMGITDVSNQYSGTNPTYGTYYNPGYTNTYGQGREMSYKRLSLELTSKFFITTESQIRPFVGAGLGYNRHDLSYDNNTQYNLGSVQLGNENFASSFVSGSVNAGAEIHFSETIGAGLEFKYMKSFGSSFNSQSASTNTNPDQQRLENVGTAIEEANNMSLNAALIIKF
ncbi:OmpW family outer membrane protein [Halobacteriovorax sp. HLS]|uniref:OmpW family outer membrane protein n=1 Tax=Halobacteriovorax sp. HLS TaxID=2234000 RepID=UPI000FDA34EF|nr:OmpW family outer membrane protein [Halobacteriovorax sp. HLS]